MLDLSCGFSVEMINNSGAVCFVGCVGWWWEKMKIKILKPHYNNLKHAHTTQKNEEYGAIKIDLFYYSMEKRFFVLKNNIHISTYMHFTEGVSNLKFATF